MAPVFSVFEYEDRTVEYIYRPPKRDRRHLLVIFSGGFVGGIDFAGQSTHLIESAILWIRDPHNSYYIQKGADQWYAHSTGALIAKHVSLLDITEDDVVLLGASKGGTAALYHGLSGGYKNIVASAPRIHPAKGNKQQRPQVVEELVGSNSFKAENAFDQLIPQLLIDSTKEKNIYIFTSPADNQYLTDIEPNIALFEQFTNFNLICTDSPSVNQHEDVTLYNIQPIISIIGLLTDGFAPKLDRSHNGLKSTGNMPGSVEKSPFFATLVNDVDKLEVRQDGLWIAGRSFIRGYDTSEYGSARRYLQLQRGRKIHRAYLGGLKDRRNNRDYFDHESISYTAGGYAPQGNKPINLDGLDAGTYEARMQVTTENTTLVSSEFNVRPTYSFHSIKDFIVSIDTNGSSIKVTKIPIHLKTTLDGQYTLEDYWLRDGRIHLSGRFSLNNIDISAWSDVEYRLLFLDESTRHSTSQVALAKYNRDLNPIPWRDNSKSNYSTPRHRGITLPQLSPGNYRLALIGSFKKFIQTVDTNLTLAVGDNPNEFQLVKH